MKPVISREAREILAALTHDRERTNILKNMEQKALVYLVQKIPSWIKSDGLTLIGFCGSLIVLVSFILATYLNKYWLLLGLPGFLLNWFGDSLDGRLAYYRQTPRKWYGFTLDLLVDWMSTIMIGFGYLIYTEGKWELVGFGFVVMYGWAMLIAIIRFKVTDKYTIDSGILGPTEVRIIISAIMVAEIFVRGALLYAALAAGILLFIYNILDTFKLLRVANRKDRSEKSRENKNTITKANGTSSPDK
jgi:phosphatidylglycerophosphate synthase